MTILDKVVQNRALLACSRAGVNRIPLSGTSKMAQMGIFWSVWIGTYGEISRIGPDSVLRMVARKSDDSEVIRARVTKWTTFVRNLKKRPEHATGSPK